MYRTLTVLNGARQSAEFAATLSREQRARLLQQPDALLAALCSQLHRRDTVVVEGSDSLLHTAVSLWFPQGGGPKLHALHGPVPIAHTIAVGMAMRIADWHRPATAAQQAVSIAQPVIVALMTSLPTDEALLAMIHSKGLAVLLIAMCEPETRAETQKRLQASPIPLLTVDCSDAVALCRVVQESLLRARNGWGGTLVHAVVIAGSDQPLATLATHLQLRGLLPEDPFANTTQVN